MSFGLALLEVETWRVALNIELMKNLSLNTIAKQTIAASGTERVLSIARLFGRSFVSEILDIRDRKLWNDCC